VVVIHNSALHVGVCRKHVFITCRGVQKTKPNHPEFSVPFSWFSLAFAKLPRLLSTRLAVAVSYKLNKMCKSFPEGSWLLLPTYKNKIDQRQFWTKTTVFLTKPIPWWFRTENCGFLTTELKLNWTLKNIRRTRYLMSCQIQSEDISCLPSLIGSVRKPSKLLTYWLLSPTQPSSRWMTGNK